MYVRFVVSEMAEDSGQKLGILHAIRYMNDDGDLTDTEFKFADKIMTWFANNLESPLNNMNKQKLKKSEVYISWFKAEAKEHIAKARELASILEIKDVLVEMIATDKPGKIVYEDKYQIFSKPYKIF